MVLAAATVTTRNTSSAPTNLPPIENPTRMTPKPSLAPTHAHPPHLVKRHRHSAPSSLLPPFPSCMPSQVMAAATGRDFSFGERLYQQVCSTPHSPLTKGSALDLSFSPIPPPHNSPGGSIATTKGKIAGRGAHAVPPPLTGLRRRYHRCYSHPPPPPPLCHMQFIPFPPTFLLT